MDRRLKQILDFIDSAKDIEDLPELTHFVQELLWREYLMVKRGFPLLFSAKNTSTEKIINNITKRGNSESLLLI